MLATTALFGIGPRYAMGGVIVEIYPFPCSTEACDYLCSFEHCGDPYCAGGQCLNDPKNYPHPVCLCNPR